MTSATTVTVAIMNATPAIDPGRAVCSGDDDGVEVTVQLATDSALASRLHCAGVAVGPGAEPGSVVVATGGVVSNAISALGAGAACAVGVDADGRLVRATDPAWLRPADAAWAGSRIWLGYCSTEGT